MRVGFFIDVSNFYFTIKKKFNGKFNYRVLFDNFDGEVIVAKAYGAQEKDEAVNFIHMLTALGFDCKFKKPRTVGHNIKKADWDVGISLDAIKYAPKLDYIVLGTSDGDFRPLIEYLQTLGTDVIVLGCNISYELKQVAMSAIEIDEKYFIKEPENAELPVVESGEDSGEDESGGNSTA